MAASDVSKPGEGGGEPAEGRRDARKRRTRAALHDCATRLTAQRGFHDATIAEIATCAGVSPRTFFAYFPTKEAALFAPLDDLVGSLEQALAAPNDNAPDALVAFRTWLTGEVFASGALEAVTSAGFRQLALGEPAIAAHGLQFVDRVTTALTLALRAGWKTPQGDPLPASAAAAVVAAALGQLPAGSRALVEMQEVDEARMLADVDRAIAFVRAGIAALAAPSGAPAT